MAEHETPSTTHLAKHDEMERALNDIVAKGPKLRLGHVAAPGKAFFLNLIF